jgi:hypothetical protein
MKHSPIRALAVIGAALVLMSGGAFVYATANPGNPTTITSCVNKTSGVIRIIDPAKTTCAKNETALTWNQQGVPGTNDTPGTNGTNGVSGYEIVSRDVNISPNSFGSAAVGCPAGKKVVGGGAIALSALGESISSAITWEGSFPSADGTSWSVGYSNSASGFVTGIRIRAACVTAS